MTDPARFCLSQLGHSSWTLELDPCHSVGPVLSGSGLCSLRGSDTVSLSLVCTQSVDWSWRPSGKVGRAGLCKVAGASSIIAGPVG